MWVFTQGKKQFAGNHVQISLGVHHSIGLEETQGQALGKEEMLVIFKVVR